MSYEVSGRKSTSVVEIVPVEFEKHPNADSLSVTQVFGGYSYVGNSKEWAGIKKAAYIPPDNIVDTDRPEFRFLREKPIRDAEGNIIGKVEDPKIKKVRVKAKQLRGIISFGLMVPVPDDAVIGDDWTERLGVEHYDPEAEQEKGGKVVAGDTEAEPDLNTGPKYDIDAGRKYAKILFTEGEPCLVQEKLDGSNCRVVWHQDRLWVKTRNYWKKRTSEPLLLTVETLMQQPGMTEERANEIVAKAANRKEKVSDFWAAVEKYPGITQLCKDNPGLVVFGEVYGSTNLIKYGFPDGNRFAAFDLYQAGRYYDWPEAKALYERYEIPYAPVLSESTPFDFDKICSMAEGLTLAEDAKAKTIREGVVIRPVQERRHPKYGRCVLKFVSGAFLEKH